MNYLERMSRLKNRQKSVLLAAVYILCIAVSAVGDSEFLPSSAKVLTLGAVGLALLILGLTGDLTNLKQITGYFGLYVIWLFVILFYSMSLWILHMESFEFILRGSSKTVFQFIFILVLCAAAYLFGERSIHYTFYGLVLGNTLIALLYIPQFGLTAAAGSLMQFLVRGVEFQVDYAVKLEIHDITFTYGFFIIYFSLFCKGDKFRWVKVLVALFFFYIGYKRIALGALPVALVLGFLLKKLTQKRQVRLMRILAYLLIGLSVVYLWSIKTGTFLMLMKALKMDLMGRDILYSYLNRYYELRPGFIGYGFEYVHVIMLEILQNGDQALNGIVDLHNDFMRVYIEMGFFGFMAWGWYTLAHQLRWINDHSGTDAARLFFLCEVYIFITYLTDNTLFYFYTGFVLRLIPLAYALRGGGRETEHLPFSEPEEGRLTLFHDTE